MTRAFDTIMRGSLFIVVPGPQIETAAHQNADRAEFPGSSCTQIADEPRSERTSCKPLGIRSP